MGLRLRKDGQRRSAFELLSYPDIGIADLARIWPSFGELDRRRSPSRSKSTPNTRSISAARPPTSSPIAATKASSLPEDIDYAALPGLSNEVRHKLQTHRPRTIGQAGRIDGMTPAALTLLVAHLRRQGSASRAVALIA